MRNITQCVKNIPLFIIRLRSRNPHIRLAGQLEADNFNTAEITYEPWIKKVKPEISNMIRPLEEFPKHSRGSLITYIIIEISSIKLRLWCKSNIQYVASWFKRPKIRPNFKKLSFSCRNCLS